MACKIASLWVLLVVKATSLVLDRAPVGKLDLHHFWTTRGGDPFGSRTSPFTAPVNFSSGPTWKWDNAMDEQVRHSPLIDANKDIYITTATRIRKFSPEGKVHWTYTIGPTEGKITASPSLYQDALCFFSSEDGVAHVSSLRLADGGVNWRNDIDVFVNMDAHSTFAYNDTLLMPVRDHMVTRRYPGGDDGNNAVLALSMTDGRKVWQYVADDLIWNFVPATPGDGTLLFATNCGAVHRIGFDGKRIWRVGSPNPGHWCSTGGGSLGPNGVFYNEYNYNVEQAHIDARRVSDGELLWSKTFERGYGGWQYPAVGKVGKDGTLAVVAAIGSMTGPPPYPVPHTPASKQIGAYNQYLEDASTRAKMGAPKLKNAIVAMDAGTGKILWRFEEEVWDHFGPKGDEENLLRRVARSEIDHQADVICLPDIQGIPLVSGDGFVYASSSHAGDLRSMRDENRDGIITTDEISTFPTNNCFLNAPSIAPGMLVAAPCWGPVYVFKSDTQ